MSAVAPSAPVLSVADGLVFESSGARWALPPVELAVGGWVALVPDDPQPGDDPTHELSRILGTVLPPQRGQVRFLQQDVYALSSMALQRLRVQLGFVHRVGGLLSNLSIRGNIAMPVSVHRQLAAESEREHVTALLDELGLLGVADHLPHQLNGLDRWRSCLARALALDPVWLIVEGMTGGSPAAAMPTSWRALLRRRTHRGLCLVICLPAADAEFESTFVDCGGEVLRYGRAEVTQ